MNYWVWTLLSFCKKLTVKDNMCQLNHKDAVIRSSHQRGSIIKGVPRNFTKSTGTTCARVSFLINYIKKETLTQVFSCGFCEISKTSFYRTRHSGWLLLIYVMIKDHDMDYLVWTMLNHVVFLNNGNSNKQYVWVRWWNTF